MTNTKICAIYGEAVKATLEKEECMEFYDYLLNSAATISGAIGFVLLILEVRKKDGKGINVSLAILAIALLLFYKFAAKGQRTDF